MGAGGGRVWCGGRVSVDVLGLLVACMGGGVCVCVCGGNRDRNGKGQWPVARCFSLCAFIATE
jgi:hypothetical protein